MAHPFSRVVVPRLGSFCVVVTGFPGLDQSSHEFPAGQLWEALAASESRGTHKANQQPTNSTSSQSSVPEQGSAGTKEVDGGQSRSDCQASYPSPESEW